MPNFIFFSFSFHFFFGPHSSLLYLLGVVIAYIRYVKRIQVKKEKGAGKTEICFTRRKPERTKTKHENEICVARDKNKKNEIRKKKNRRKEKHKIKKDKKPERKKKKRKKKEGSEQIHKKIVPS